MRKTIIIIAAALFAVSGARADFILALDAALKQACPEVTGVSIGNPDDKRTWRVDYAADATCQAAAAKALTAFDPTLPANNPVYVQGATLLGRLAPTEYVAINKAAQTQLSDGDGTLALWLDQVKLSRPPGINLNDAATAAIKGRLVAAGALTAVRAGIVFAP